jgi:hypothetical protein
MKRLGIPTRQVVSLETMAQWEIAMIPSIIFIGSLGEFKFPPFPDD